MFIRPDLRWPDRLVGLTRFALILACGFLSTFAAAAAAEPSHDTRLTGTVGDVVAPDRIWVGAIEVRLRKPFVFEDKKEAALSFMRKLAPNGRKIECRLTGERLGRPEEHGTLVGECTVLGDDGEIEVDPGARLIEQGFARPCREPQAVIAIWPPVFDCH